MTDHDIFLVCETLKAENEALKQGIREMTVSLKEANEINSKMRAELDKFCNDG